MKAVNGVEFTRTLRASELLFVFHVRPQVFHEQQHKRDDRQPKQDENNESVEEPGLAFAGLLPLI